MSVFSFQPGHLVAVRGPAAVALIDDTNGGSEAAFGLIAAIGSGDSGLIRAAVGEARQAIAVGVAWCEGDRWRIDVSRDIRVVYETPSATTSVVPRIDGCAVVAPSDASRVGLIGERLTDQNVSAWDNGVVRASAVWVEPSGVFASEVSVTADVAVSPALSEETADKQDPDPHEGDVGSSVSQGSVVAVLSDLAPPAGEPRAVAPPPLPAADPAVVEASTQVVRLVDLDAAAEPATPLPTEGDAAAEVADVVQVLGVRCPVDHHNHPDALYCSQCGRRMGVNHTAVALMGPRPPLGLFLIDDVATYSIATDFVIGRDPMSHPDVADDAPALILEDDTLEISRAHVEIALDNWSVTARDLGSANGTSVRRAGEVAWSPLDSERAVTLGPGDVLRVGQRELQLELHHVQT